jgi:energy-coupling factor transporter ATP-binding protein EcfA2
MISSLTIEGFRCFERLEMGGLGRVNLIVGKNNSGKTSVLEALHLLCRDGDPAVVWDLATRRGETVPMNGTPRRAVDVSHFFRGHALVPGARFLVRAETSRVSFAIEELQEAAALDRLYAEENSPASSPFRLKLMIAVSRDLSNRTVVLGRDGELRLDFLDDARRNYALKDEPARSRLLGPESPTVPNLIRLWGRIALTKDEALVLGLLRTVAPDIEKIADLGSAVDYASLPQRGGFRVKLNHMDGPVPMGTMGDGVYRTLVLALALASTKGGTLLIDEVETGLHHQALAQMWRLVFRSAKEADVQVFATTHSWDCVEAFASLIEETDDANRISMQRVEAGKASAVSYEEREIKVVAEQGVEAR